MMDSNNFGFQHPNYGYYTPSHGPSYEFIPNTIANQGIWTTQPMEPILRPPSQMNPYLLSHPPSSQYQQQLYLNPVLGTNYNWPNPLLSNNQYYQVTNSAKPPQLINPYPIYQNDYINVIHSDPNLASLQASPSDVFVKQGRLRKPVKNQAMPAKKIELPSQIPFDEISLADQKSSGLSQNNEIIPLEANSNAQDPSEPTEIEKKTSLESEEVIIASDKICQVKVIPKKKPRNPVKSKTLVNQSKIKINKALQKKKTSPGDLRELLTKTSKAIKDPVDNQIVKGRDKSNSPLQSDIVPATLKKQRSSKLLQMLEPLLRMNYSIRLKSTGQSDGSSRYTISLTKKRKLIPPNRLSSLYDSGNSVLINLASYRLTKRFSLTGKSITDSSFTHNICPHDYICLPDLIGTCPDKSCLYQHRSNYLMTDIEKLVDILSYKPSLTGFRSDASLSQEENAKNCRLKLKQYAAKLIAKNSDKSVETIAQNLLPYVRGDKSDHDLLVMRRKLPKVSQMKVEKTIDNNELQSRQASIKSLVNRLSVLEKTQAELQKTFK